MCALRVGLPVVVVGVPGWLSALRFAIWIGAEWQVYSCGGVELRHSAREVTLVDQSVFRPPDPVGVAQAAPEPDRAQSLLV